MGGIGTKAGKGGGRSAWRNGRREFGSVFRSKKKGEEWERGKRPAVRRNGKKKRVRKEHGMRYCMEGGRAGGKRKMRLGKRVLEIGTDRETERKAEIG